MEQRHLDYLLGFLPANSPHVYTENVDRSAMGNYIAAARSLKLPHRVGRTKKGFQFLQLLREDGTLIGTINPTRLVGCPPATRQICNSKILTSEFFRNAEVQSPSEQAFSPSEKDAARSYAFERHERVAVKAYGLSLGRGIFLEVDEENFESAFDACVAEQVKRKQKPMVIVQEMVNGFEMRATVVEGVLHSVVVRIPAYVTGDGKSTLDQLINAKNARRDECLYFARKPIAKNENFYAQLSKTGLTTDSVPAMGENVLLTPISSVAYGGETLVATHLVSQEIKDLAVKATTAIPGLTTAGVDIMATGFDDTEPVALEINNFPHAQIGIYPAWGESVNSMEKYLSAIYARDRFEAGEFERLTKADMETVSNFQAFQRRCGKNMVKWIGTQI